MSLLGPPGSGVNDTDIPSLEDQFKENYPSLTKRWDQNSAQASGKNLDVSFLANLYNKYYPGNPRKAWIWAQNYLSNRDMVAAQKSQQERMQDFNKNMRY